MRILIYGLNYSPELTGIGKFTGEMAKWLSDKGHDVRIVTAPPYYPAWRVSISYKTWVYRKERLGGVKVWRCPLWVPRQPSGLTRILHLTSFVLSSFPVLLYQIRRHPDVIMTIEPTVLCAPFGLLAGSLAKAGTWLHIQDFEMDAAFELGLLRHEVLKRLVTALERWWMRRFDRVSTISPRMIDRLSSKGVTKERQVLFPNWVNTDEIYPLDHTSVFRKEIGIPEHGIVALYSGNMEQKQGLDIVIEAARRLQRNKNIQFVLCGQGAAYQHLRDMASGLDNVYWLPLQPVERLNELLGLADIHLLPQRADAADLVMPSKLTGMLASGKPVVATAAKDTEVWQMVQGRGLIVEPDDAKAFANAILNLSEDPTRRQSFGVAARSYAVTHLDYEKIMEGFETELLKLTRAQAKRKPL